MNTSRYSVHSLEDAWGWGWLPNDNHCPDGGWGLFDNEQRDRSTGYPMLVAEDGGEPEDATFVRDFKWVPVLLNSLAADKAELIKTLEDTLDIGREYKKIADDGDWPVRDAVFAKAQEVLDRMQPA
jgi:hypothetical protein